MDTLRLSPGEEGFQCPDGETDKFNRKRYENGVYGYRDGTAYGCNDVKRKARRKLEKKQHAARRLRS